MPRVKSSSAKMTETALNLSAYGQEFKPGSNIIDAFNWYHYSCDDTQAKSFLLTYLKENNTDYYSKIERIDKNLIYAHIPTACWMARMMTIGFELDDNKVNNFYKFLDRIIKKNEIENTDKNVIKWKSSYNPLASKVLGNYHKALNEILDAIQIYTPKIGKPNISIEGTLKEHSVHKFYKDDFVKELTAILAELESALDKNNEEIFETYRQRGYSPLMLRRKKDFVVNVIYYVEDYFNKINKKQKVKDITNLETGKIEQVIVSVEKKPRKPRKKKVKSPDKIISRLQYLQEYPDLKLKSIDPKKILGASEVWLFNVRYSQLQVYRASSENGLSIKGTTLINFDENKSNIKRIGRHTEEILEKVSTSGKVVLRRVMDEISSVGIKATGRIGENTIILRAL